ncbi:MAG: glycoside hydrolase family 2 protein, partial [Clostridiales bacterium]|nr:glycoside hydrolase family 2 protein [Clostridiales bacterium]
MKRQCFNDHWVFYKRDSDSKLKVTLPHDAQIIQERDASAPGGSAHAFFPGGYYIYEKSFDVPAGWQDKCISFQFEGVYKDAKVFINGKEAGGRPNGYTPFFVNGDDLLDYGAANTIRVEVDNVDLPNSRWYTGAGIYRPVWLWIGAKSHIEMEGIQISTLSISPARIKVKTAHVGGDVSVEIRENDAIIAKGDGDQIELDIPNAKLWSAEKPNLYTCHVTLSENGAIVDEVSETFGIREITWSNKGLFINGQETLLRGGCVHHDNGILGARSFAKSEERRVRIMKEAGFNAIRSSHNLASKGMIEACDKYGVYIIDETWDMWYSHKSKYDYATDFVDNWRDDIRAMVSRDYNHPSVIMYSIGNEVAEPATAKGVDLAKEMVALLHSLDSTRAVTAGMNLMILSRSAKGNAIYKEDGGRDESSEKKAQGMNSTMFNIVASMVGTSMNMGANSK